MPIPVGSRLLVPYECGTTVAGVGERVRVEVATGGDDEHALSNLWNAVVGRVHRLPSHVVLGLVAPGGLVPPEPGVMVAPLFSSTRSKRWTRHPAQNVLEVRTETLPRQPEDVLDEHTPRV